MYCNESNSKKAKINHYLYLLQEIKTKRFLKKMPKRDLTEIFDDEKYSTSIKKTSSKQTNI